MIIQTISQIIAIILLSIGFCLMAIAVVGIFRLPDFYSRLHAAGKIDSLGVALTLLGLIIYNGFSLTSGKILLIIIFVFLTSTLGAHLLAKAAYSAGIKPWTKKENQQATED